MEELAQRLISWIREQVTTANCQGAVVGTSGGLDSALVAVLCKRAFPQNTLGVLMPCYSSKTDLDDAQIIARKFDIPTITVVLDEPYDSLLKILPSDGFSPETQKIAEANLKPRLRMITLYYLANRLNYLVMGTGNRSELAVGYFTKYGDGGVDALPLGNLVKSEVKELARYLDIPGRIIGKVPSGGLWAGQTDEGEMGITYEELDQYLLTGEAGEGVREKLNTLVQSSAHKRESPPIPS